MKKINLIFLALSMFGSISAFSKSLSIDTKKFWSNEGNTRYAGRDWMPVQFQVFQLKVDDLKNFLAPSPADEDVALRTSDVIVELPNPDGHFQRFRMSQSLVMAPELSHAYPFIKTYKGSGISDPYATLRLTITQFGLDAFVISPGGTYYIEPYIFGQAGRYIAYYKKDIPEGMFSFNCGFEEGSSLLPEGERGYEPTAITGIGATLRTYRLALGATGEYTAYYGGTVAGGLAGIVTSMNRINGVYEREVAVRMVLVPNDTLIIYTNSSTDPYTNSNGGTMLGQNQTTCDNLIGSANYDVGHVFSTGGGGIASLGVPCRSGQKAKGVTGSPSPINDPFNIDYVAHEMGHQFGANHTFNATTSACGGGNRASSAAYEPGSGSTIMSYAGICGSTNDLQNNSDAYFHTKSFDEIVAYTQSGSGNSCPVITNTGNSEPVITMPGNYIIPFQTPFRLTAAGTDPDGDSLTYCWEQYDLGAAGSWNAPSGDAPIFRSFTGTSNPTRLFPKLTDILNNTTTKGEIKPSYARTLHFRCTARDNRAGGGGVVHNNTLVNVQVINTGTGFAVTYPNTTGITWYAGTTQTVTWDTANTKASPISTPNVNILLSTNNGQSFPIVIGSAVPNTGSYSFTVPSLAATQARIMVEGAGNIFFDINDKTFIINNTVDISENDAGNNLVVFPNPASGFVYILLNDLSDQPGNVVISDLTGRKIITRNFEPGKNNGSIAIDISKLSKGIYVCTVEFPSGRISKRVVVE